MINKKNQSIRAVFIICTVLSVTVFAGCGNGGGGGGGAEESGSEPTPVTYTISGKILAADNALVDSDVNDPLATYAPNDRFGEAQELPNPVILGGYVNLPGAGPSGRSQSRGDVSDFFYVILTAGQSIILFIASDPELVDLDLYIYDDLENLIDSAMGTGSQESLVAPEDGGYFVEVRARASASSYNLTIGQSTADAIAETLRLSDEFVPGEVIVRFEGDTRSSKNLISPAGQEQMPGMQVKAGAPGRGMLLRFDKETGRQQALRALGIRKSVSHGHRHLAADPDQEYKLDTLQIIKSLRQRSDVRYAAPNYIRKALAIPNDPLYSRQWHYPLINLPQSWDVTTGSNSVVVAVVDTGVLSDHPDLANRLTAEGYDFISDPSRALDGDGIDPDPDDPGDASLGGSSFHGTHVSGIIAAETDNDAGVAGVLWSTLIMPLRVLGLGGGTDYDILQAVRYAAGLENDSGTLPLQKADIVNLSLGGINFSQAAQDVFSEVRAEGLIIIAAAGNSASTTLFYPAAYQGVLSVSAVDINQDWAPYSNFGPTIDVAAPGGDNSADVNLDGFPDGVLSTCGNDVTGSIDFVYCYFQGTSMAAPHVAGVVALMKAVYPALTPEDVDILLANGSITEDIGSDGRDDRFGNGLIDAFKALEAAQGLADEGGLPLTVLVSPTALNFGLKSTAVLRIEQGGGSVGDQLVVGAVGADVPWLTVEPATADSIDAARLGTYEVSLDRNSLDPGIYSATITVDAVDPTVNSVEVPVSVQKNEPIVGGNTGFHYVLLIDAETFEIKDQDNVPFESGQDGYSYAFAGVPSGTYQIFGGTDLNNDFFLGDPGEAYGAYLTLDQPLTVTISADQSGLDFTTNYDVTIRPQLDIGMMPDRPALKRFKNRKEAR
jgi:serine protease